MIPAELRARIEAALADPSLPADMRAELRRWLSPIVPGDPADIREQINRDLARVSAGRTAQQAVAARARLAEQRERLASQGGAGLATADELLDTGRLGLRFFESFLPLYGRCEEVPYFGSVLRMSVADLQARYDAEQGLRLSSFRADAQHVRSAQDRLGDVNDVLDDAGLQLAQIWDGAASRAALAYYRQFGVAADLLRRQIGTTGDAVHTATTTVESVIFEKVRSVLSLYRETSGGFDAAAVEAIIEVALGAPHGWGQVLTWFGGSGRGASGRRLAQLTAQQWLENSFKPDVEMQLRLFLQSCDWCRRGIREAFALVEVALASIAPDPFRALPHRIDPEQSRRPRDPAQRHAHHPGHMTGQAARPALAQHAHVGRVSHAPATVDASTPGHRNPSDPPPRRQPLTPTTVSGAGRIELTSGAPRPVRDDASATVPADIAALASRSEPLGNRASSDVAAPPEATIADPSATAASGLLAGGRSGPTATGPAAVASGLPAAASIGATSAPPTHGGWWPGLAMPLIPAGRSGPREAHRRFRVFGDLFGADDLARWDELRPVLGEELR